MKIQNSNKTTVSLVLGSGGARGLAHIGVIKWLEENNFEIKSISGCSIGSLIGGVYAAGKLDQLENWNENGFLKNRLDLDKIGVFGHSRGGGAAGQLTIKDTRIKAAVNIS